MFEAPAAQGRVERRGRQVHVALCRGEIPMARQLLNRLGRRAGTGTVVARYYEQHASAGLPGDRGNAGRSGGCWGIPTLQAVEAIERRPSQRQLDCSHGSRALVVSTNADCEWWIRSRACRCRHQKRRCRSGLVRQSVLANPDLPQRLKIGAALNPPDPDTFTVEDSMGALTIRSSDPERISSIAPSQALEKDAGSVGRRGFKLGR